MLKAHDIPTSAFSASEVMYRCTDIARAAGLYGRDIASLPYVHRILLENLCRSILWGKPVTDRDIRSLLEPSAIVSTDLPLYVSRVMLPDSSGLPVLQDLAALRSAVAAAGGEAESVDARIPVDLIVDHSLQVDFWGDGQAERQNLQREIERNSERYRFLKWARQAFPKLRVFPPGTGIIHQVNLEHIASVVDDAVYDNANWAFPDFVIGGDSHTPMINGLGVLGWGVGGIDVEAAVLGQAYVFPYPKVVGVKLTGSIIAPALTTDAALLITQRLRAEKVAGCMVEFFGPAVASLSVAERTTFANMAPEYGATCGFFPVDEQTISYLTDTGRSARRIALVEAYCRSSRLWRTEVSECPQYDRVVAIDLSEAEPSIAGPHRPQDRLPLAKVRDAFRGWLPTSFSGAPPSDVVEIERETIVPGHGSIVLAAITSCTNTSNPIVMLAAGLVAKRANDIGMQIPCWVKTSMAPGSRAVTAYLDRVGLLTPLEELGFNVVGYGCTTCGGKSGPLPPKVARDIEDRKLIVASILSGNRNFEGRIHKLIRANFIGSPPLVVLYALVGRIDIDFTNEPVGQDRYGNPVFLKDLWPTPAEITALLPATRDPVLFSGIYGTDSPSASLWEQLPAPTGAIFPWDRSSHYLVEPPFFRRTGNDDAVASLAQDLEQAYALAAFGDSLTTDHISPSGEIPTTTPAGQYLMAAGIEAKDFNTYVGRRGNFEVMTRGTFANVRIKNDLVKGTEGGFTRHFPDGEQMTIYAAASRYRQEGLPTIILAGAEYGTGSSRDWAAKGMALLGIRAVIAESFERIHRANLVGMGILPLAFRPGEGWKKLGLTGSERFSFEGIPTAIRTGSPVTVKAVRPGKSIVFETIPQLLTGSERILLGNGGMPQSVLKSFLMQAREVPKRSS